MNIVPDADSTGVAGDCTAQKSVKIVQLIPDKNADLNPRKKNRF